MATQISVEEMERTRVARFKRLTPTRRGFVDTAIPGYERLIYNVIGRGVTEDPTLNPAITDARDFNLTLVKKAPGNRVGLHEQWDVISVPPGVMRGFRNAGTEDAFLLAILGGSDSGHVTWSPKVLETARQHGVELDAQGNVHYTPR